MSKNKKNTLMIGGSVSFDFNDIENSDFAAQVNWNMLPDVDEKLDHLTTSLLVAGAVFQQIETYAEYYVSGIENATDRELENAKARIELETIANIMTYMSTDDFSKGRSEIDTK